MAPRVRRPNAGNRLQALISEQVPLSDAEAEYFAERDDDEDFDLEAEEERLRLERLAAEQSDNSGEENQGSGNEDDSGDDTDGVHDDENFSDTSDDSESDRDDIPADEGEKQLQKETRQNTKEKRIAERNKMFKIKQRPPPRSENDPPKEPKRKPIFSSADLLMEQGRHSERASAMKNKQHLIEQMREAEKRRAQYVPPKRKHVHKLTQEERLEEAKKTEAKNLSSLNKFVELEEERKIQQRLAMISKRPRLTHFVRFHSSQYWETPKLIEVQDPEDLFKEEMRSETSFYQPMTSQVEIKAELPTTNVEPTFTKAEELPKVENSKVENFKPESSKPENSKPENSKSESSNPEESKHEGPKSENFEPEESKLEESKLEESKPENSKPEDPLRSEEPLKSEEATLAEGSGEAGFVKEEDVMEVDEKPLVQGPPRLRSYNFLTLHEFQDVHINRYSIRSIILGPVASTIQQPPLKRMCPFTGKAAKYVDPSTGVAYTDLETNKLIALARKNQLGWSKELGGVFTSNGKPQRHAKGVPEGFA